MLPNSASVVEPGSTPAIPQDSASRDSERVLLLYSPLWMAAVGAVMVTRRMASWGDVEHLLLGLGLAALPWIYPFTRRAARADGGRPLAARWAVHFTVAITLTTFIQTYFGSALFFDQLGMEYHFHTGWLLNRTPLFLYFMTVCYFSTYYTILMLLHRLLAGRLAGAPLIVARFALCYAVAFGETWFMASDLISDFFSYRDRRFTLLVGSIGYGFLLFVTLPVFLRLATTPAAARPPLKILVRDVLAANMLSLIGYEVFAHLIGKPW